MSRPIPAAASLWIIVRMYYGERFNGYTHLAGTVLAAAGAAFLVSIVSAKADPLRVASISVYGSTLCLLYLVSTLYHCTQGRAKQVFRKLDHCAIYLMIAGTYTPFALVSANATWGWTLLIAIWSLAVVGILQECFVARGPRLTSLAIYLIMGWLALVDLVPLVEVLTWNGFAWVLGGGVVYTAGILFYLFDDRYPHWHGIWHLFVLVGSAAHYTAILKFVA